MIRSLNEKESYKLLEVNYIGHLAYIFDNKPFVVPITYYFDTEKNVIIGYSAKGHKVTAMRRNSSVSLEVSEIDSVNDWKSVLVHGTYEELENTEATARIHDFSLGVKDLIVNKEQRKLDFISQFSSKIYKDDFPIVFHINIESITGKLRLL